MLQAAKNMFKLKPWYTGLYVFVLSILLLSSYLEYKSRYRDLLQLIQDQAAMTAAVIAQSGSGQAYLTAELKQSYIDRALDILNILNRIDEEKKLSQTDIDDLLNAESIMNISTFDSKGKLEITRNNLSKNSILDSPSDDTWLQNQVKSIVSGQQSTIVIGIDEALYFDSDKSIDSEKFLVAIARNRGGAFACQLSLEAEEDYKYLTAMEAALDELLLVKGLLYLSLSLDNSEPYYVSKYDERVDESWSREPLADILFKVSKGDNHILEVVRPVFFDTSLGEVRIGFKADTFFNLRSQIVYQILIRTTLFTSLAFVLLIFFLVRRNAILLTKEKQRIEAEVYRLEKLNRLREKQAAVGELAAGVAHEIRNPLNAIGIIAQRLKREFSTGDDQEEFEGLTGTMVSEISRINTSLQDFLDYTKPTPLSISTLDMGDFLESIQELYISETIEKEIALTTHGKDIEFKADAEYLRQAVSNLVRNAIDACDVGATIDLKGLKVGDTVKIIVQDTGAGIAADQISRVFDLYFTTKDMGTGVGLALTHKIIADHHGTIEVTSNVGVGSTFEIELPVK